MSEMRACKECGKMFMPKGREKYCSDVHYRPCPVCGTPVIAKYLSDPPCKCKDCKGKKMQPASSAKKLFNIDEPKFPNMTIPTIDLAKAIKLEKAANNVREKSKMNTANSKLATVNNDIEAIKIGLDPEKFCEELDGKILRYIGPNTEGQHRFIKDHDYKVAMNLKDNTYLLTSSHDLTSKEETSCFYIFSSQISVGNRFAIVTT